ncbi:5'-nucleotidase C-terminal domain-containing protein [Flavihumibacter stibioxidans]|uniref:5'-Nucleotidase C-terminal domain-containing protein n=1 Tax=Flavihumibacter stibioxidans TaxID=1834163 RepID=A0ABR7MDD3_9BACT|nr:5'-nucleotidase C-terminal domain-containing protein [Flavihumibacter stibioxidans]MBC6492967.1 hypothetical protein [Flavihumibacter stibioxidans]
MSKFSRSVLQASAVLLALAFTACNRYYQPASMQYDKLRITQDAPRSAAIGELLRPYSDSVNASMNTVIGETAVVLEKKQPEGVLGNLLADAVKSEAGKLYGVKVDIAFINYGGIRLHQLPAGPLTLGKVYELMPFDNIMIIQRLKGSVLQELLDNVASRGGWPGSGVSYIIKDKKATEVKVGGLPLDYSATYIVANSDYVASGGDNCDMLRSIPQENKGVLVRDALISYLGAFAKRGEKINASLENRVQYAQ